MGRAEVVAEGKRWIGKLNYSQLVRYDFRDGGSADCSSFFQHCMQVGAGYDPGDWTVPQFNNGTSISRSQLQPGDAVFYGMGGGMRHVVLYIGDGQCLSQGGPGKGPVVCAIDYRGDISGYRSYLGVQPAPPTPVGSEDHSFALGQMIYGSTGPYVKFGQRLLQQMGYYQGHIDGKAETGTMDAVEKLQRAKGISVDRSCGQVTWSAMTNLIHTGWTYVLKHVYEGCPSTDSVLVVQRLLNSYGYTDDSGATLTPDGDCGKKTVEAIKRAQIANGLKVDGDAGPKTLKVLVGL